MSDKWDDRFDAWNDRFESVLDWWELFGWSAYAAIVGVIVGTLASWVLGLPIWLGGFVCAAIFGLGTLVLLRALDAEEERNQP